MPTHHFRKDGLHGKEFVPVDGLHGKDEKDEDKRNITDAIEREDVYTKNDPVWIDPR